MKNFYLLLCFLATATFSYAQELTPDMLVGEYEGTAEILYPGASETEMDKKAKLTITKVNKDSCLLHFLYHGSPLKCYLILQGDSLTISYHNIQDLGDITSTVVINHYTGDKVKAVQEIEYNVERKIFKVSLQENVTLTGSMNKNKTRYYSFNMKKK